MLKKTKLIKKCLLFQIKLKHTLRIGDISLNRFTSYYPEKIPQLYPLELHLTQEYLNHIRWLTQKDILGQDCFLIGPPGPNRRRLALTYCELAQREVEFMTLTQDSTEADLKQRREIVNGSAIFVDQGPVRAAIEVILYFII